MKAPLTILLAITVSGCATDNPAMNSEAVEPLLCQGKSQCDLYWQRAQAWIATNSAYKIQNSSDTVLQTFGPIGARVDLAYQITRVPNADGSARIIIAANCANFIRCYPTRTDAIVSFKRFVKN